MNIIIRNTGDTPIYEQIAAQLKNLIITGELRPGDPLPSMRLLSKELRISMITTRHAYELLEQDGFITTMPGKGSYVAEQNSQFIREEHLRIAEGHLRKAVESARTAGIACDELCDILNLLSEEETQL